ncbi:UDP-2,4-diacetamido-2,4,6-trideoxy-beta-L-altropyranose hydrolase [compost metagenome]
MYQSRTKVFFRADGNSKIGLGHVIRSLALAEMIKSHFDCIFLIRTPSESLKIQLFNSCVEVIELPEENSLIDEAKYIIEKYIQKEDIVVLDGYSFSTDYQKTVKRCGCKIVAIDDLHEWHFVVDVVINQAGLISIEDYSYESYTQFLLGPQYALLRKPFLRTRPYVINQNVLVNLGGADPDNISLKILEALKSFSLTITLIIGSANVHENEINHYLKLNPQQEVTIRKNLSATEMAESIGESGLVICSSSSIAYETASIGRPLIVIQTAANQRDFRAFLEKSGLCLDTFNKEFDNEMLRTTIENYFTTKTLGKTIVDAQHEYFDGLSGSRLLNVFLGL